MPALCRKLIAAGYDPQLPMEVYRGQTLALHVRSLEAVAQLTVKETATGTRFVKMSPLRTGGASDELNDDEQG